MALYVKLNKNKKKDNKLIGFVSHHLGARVHFCTSDRVIFNDLHSWAWSCQWSLAQFGYGFKVRKEKTKHFPICNSSKNLLHTLFQPATHHHILSILLVIFKCSNECEWLKMRYCARKKNFKMPQATKNGRITFRGKYSSGKDNWCGWFV